MGIIVPDGTPKQDDEGKRSGEQVRCTGCGHYAPSHYGWCTPELIERASR